MMTIDIILLRHWRGGQVKACVLKKVPLLVQGNDKQNKWRMDNPSYGVSTKCPSASASTACRSHNIG